MIGASKTPEREKFAHFSLPYRKEVMNLYVKKSEKYKFLKYKTVSDLLKNYNFKLGVVRGYFYGDEFDGLLKDENVKKRIYVVEADKVNYTKLSHGRIDGFIADKYVTYDELKKTDLLDKIEPFMKIHDNDVFFIFNKKVIGPDILEKINRGVDKIKQEGMYQKIINKYSTDH
ncbi:MAG: transporter substrate-binding domain-containing protein [Oligoflexia bacterium]|nr:transporter substrate-binding domain-containing protein [Oligoflexia bacterium]